MTSRRSLLAAASLGLAALPSAPGAETYGFKLTSAEGQIRCERDAARDAAAPADLLIVKLSRPVGIGQGVQLRARPEAGPESQFGADPSSTATEAEFRVRKGLLHDVTLYLGDPSAPDLKCPAVPQPDGGRARAAAGADPAAGDWWRSHGAEQLAELEARGRYPRGTQFLVHFANGDPAPPYPASVAERTPIQVLVVSRSDIGLPLQLTVTSCESLQPFRIRDQRAGQPQAARDQLAYHTLAYGPLIQCGAGNMSYSLELGGEAHVQSLRVRPVYHLAFTAAYGFDFTRVPTYAVEAGKVAKGGDRDGLGLRLGFTWFPFGVDYEDMRWWNAANPVFAFDPVAPTESFLVGASITPTGGLGVLVGASFHRLTVPKGVAVGADIAGSEVPTEKAWSRRGIGLFVGLSVDDDVFEAIKGRLGK